MRSKNLELKGFKMQTIQLQITNDIIANKILSILNVFKDDGVSIKSIINSDTVKDEFEKDMKQAFYELKNNKGRKSGKFVEIEI